ncbi:HAD family hydrolase [Sporomusa termitida]|uniref:Pyridoxal phosphate phosphatase YbhA n=1 Tax=Sporomusa termitida TaxID=2377 RepID=A0A517DPN3_9FIRM|nr:HAD family hydrolase [Sporomusa termitida]QDR79323.1 Pyridoxal phosphate phosphatase YbhA [Sporomusa termitida]
MTIKALYISDLDGTLLNSQKEISENTKKTLNALVARGGYFSVATARTAVSSQKILAGVQVNTPVVLMNGAVIYDMVDGTYIKAETIPPAAAYSIIEVIKKHNITGFMYSVADNRLQIYYESLNTTALTAYHNERVTKYAKSFEQIAGFSDKIKDNKVIYFAFMGQKQRLSELLPDLKKLQGIELVLSNDVYTENLWYLEVYSANASKYNAVNFIRNYCSFDRIIGFGDNVNDIPLLKACDEFYAVSNAVYELKEQATGIIADNNSDGVARFIVARREF